MSADPAALLRAVQLPGAAAVLPAWLDRAASESLSYADFLTGLLEEELSVRTAASTQRRRLAQKRAMVANMVSSPLA